MSKFIWAADLNGHKNPIVREIQVPTATAVQKGEILIFTPGTGAAAVAAPTDFKEAVFGVSMEDHDGATTGRQTGLKLEVSASPSAIYRLKSTNVITATAGSTSTFVCAGLLPGTNSLWKGGSIKILTCAADSSLIGRVVDISDSTGATGSLALAETLPSALAAGDTAYLCPGPFAIGTCWALTADATDVDWDAVAQATCTCLKLWDSNPKTLETYWLLALNQFANQVEAV